MIQNCDGVQLGLIRERRPLCHKHHACSSPVPWAASNGQWKMDDKKCRVKILIPRAKTGKGETEKSTDSATVVVVCSGFVAAVIVFHRNSSKAARAFLFFLLKSSQEEQDWFKREDGVFN